MKNMGLGLFCSLTTSVVYELPFTITVNGNLPTSYPGLASYTITKNTSASPTGNIIKYLPPNTEIATATTCGSVGLRRA